MRTFGLYSHTPKSSHSVHIPMNVRRAGMDSSAMRDEVKNSGLMVRIRAILPGQLFGLAADASGATSVDELDGIGSVTRRCGNSSSTVTSPRSIDRYVTVS